jgi:uncharacterized Fe-S cluster-containing radical SAM superfamily protein
MTYKEMGRKQLTKTRIVLMNFRDEGTISGLLTEYLAFGYLSSTLRAYGHEVIWIDEHCDGFLNANNFPFSRYKDIDIVCMSPSYITYLKSLLWLRCWKSFKPEVTTVVGGQHAMMVPEEILMDVHDIDYVCLGEGEIPLLSLAECIYRNKKADDVPNLAYRRGTTVFRNDSVRTPVDLDTLSYPDRDTLERWISQKRVTQVAMQNSRGCDYNCSFCHLPKAKRELVGYDGRFRSVSNVIHEIQYLTTKYGFREFFFCSPQFGGSGTKGQKWMLEFADQANAQLTDFKFEIECRSDALKDPKVVKCLAKAGLIRVFIGLEAATDASLKRFNKGVKIGTQIETVRLLRANGVSIAGSGMIMFHPYSTFTEMERNAEFLYQFGESKIDSLWSDFRILPGIADLDKLLQDGLVSTKRKHYQVSLYRYQDPRIGSLAKNIKTVLNAKLLLRAIRVVRLVDIEIGLEQANARAFKANFTKDVIDELGELKEDGWKLRDMIVKCFFMHFILCLRIAKKGAIANEAKKCANMLDIQLGGIKKKIDGFLSRHDILMRETS